MYLKDVTRILIRVVHMAVEVWRVMYVRYLAIFVCSITLKVPRIHTVSISTCNGEGRI